MDIAADTNIFLFVALNEPERGQIIKLKMDASISAPEIMLYEVRNALSAMVKRKRLTVAEALKAHKAVNLIPVRLVGVDIPASFKIAAEHGIYAYDACFL